MDSERKKLYASFNEHINKYFNEGELRTVMTGIEDKITSSTETRKRITEMHKSIADESALVEISSHNDILQALNYKCNLFLPDMVENYNVNIEEAILLIKEYAQKIKDETMESSNQGKSFQNAHFEDLNLKEYADSLSLLNERLVRFNLSRRDLSHCKRNLEVEEKLQQLSERVDLFMKMVKAQRVLSEEKQPNKSLDGHNTFTYNQVIESLLTKTNEASYALKKQQKVINDQHN